MKKYLVILISLVVTSVKGQQILVPDNVYFADIHLSIDKSAREKIQQNVDALLKNKIYFQQKVDRADTYFPIIERVFREAGLPDDFKYLAIQESGLVPDAISTSKAEGFWQFKKETALDFGLAVNPNIDERRHILEASRGAAKYFIQSNAYYKNWINALVSYYMGFTGAKAYARPGDMGSKDMRITDQTHIYFLTFLAHKIAFENAVGKNPAPTITLRELRATPGLSLGEIALANQTDPVELEKYNRWLLGGTVPAGKEYTVFIPVTGATASTVAVAATPSDLVAPVIVNKTITQATLKPKFSKMNGLKVIVAQAGDTKDKLALQAGMSTKKFLKLNDMYSFEEIVPGQVYYTQKKHTRGNVKMHVSQAGETLAGISQQYGMRLKSILSKNRMKKGEALVAGRVLWLQETRPANIAPEYRRIEQKEIQKTPQPLTPSTPVQITHKISAEQTEPFAGTNSKNGSSTLVTIKETASNTFHKAGAVLNVPEKQPEVAQVGGSVFEETLDLNPAPKVVKTEMPAKTTASETAYHNDLDEEVSAANETAADIVAETGSVQASVPETQPVTELKTAAVMQPAEAPKTDLVAEKNAVLYPKTVAKSTEKVALSEPVARTEENTKTLASAEKTTVLVTEPAPVKAAPKVVLKDPVTAPAPKTVSVPDKKVEKAVAQTKPATHKVAKGETLYSISKKYNATPSDLKYWNDMGEKPLSIGQELKVTGEKQVAMPVLTVTGPDKPVAEGTIVNITHRVGEGESMYQISRKYGVSIKEIMEWNNKNDFNVSAGDELLIRSRPGSSRN
ncbi:LysM peptidoglycan-binding domain-containing protein [Adhaeribacter sp. BT258]|uniref:LysM peptidoglycan-binding domain-containing protein n=1 Tax=Adhaeribacter terrigena TaxID=2793070 RepID=A0ABS1C4A7_9BACT|nr:LysM peptidoglycan-binding domain-containing protein [Adhaeribacter terrigena]MBK0404153.1 LysM peptidoglycan-binding domain-containing protein [Adhaeribacter terrigena]